MDRVSSHMFLLISMLLLYSLLRSSGAVGRCKDEEREALLKFKENLKDDYGLLSSWGKEEEKRDCCHWVGIECHNKSGHVITLDLHDHHSFSSSSNFSNGSNSWFLTGNLMNSSSLIDLHYLTYLDLSQIDFRGNQIPSFFGKMTSLAYLNLGSDNLKGFIPQVFGNMTKLTHLDLTNNTLEGEIWKSPVWDICSLRTLSLSYNNLRGELSQSFSNCKHYSLEVLDLSWNPNMGSFPNVTPFSSLKELRLSSNQINGSVPKNVGYLSHLEILDISDNSLEGVVSETHFLKLSKLKLLDLSFNKLVVNVSSDWIPPFQLDDISLSNCKLGPQFPNWLRTQRIYSRLYISNTGISDSIPNWFWNPSIGFQIVDLSGNQISGKIANSSIEWTTYPEIDLSSNQLEGPIPLFLFQVAALHLSQNKFSEINSICDVKEESQLNFLDISYNQLSGTLPNCWSYLKNLKVLNLEKNYMLSGKIPTSIGSLTQIEVLHLGNNNFTGELPLSFKNCSELIVFDVGVNNLFGPIPSWVGESLTKLVIFVLRSNHFNGSIPSNICHLQYLQLLDLSINKISGSLPKTCFGNFTEMKKVGAIFATISYSYTSSSGPREGGASIQDDKVQILWKGILSEFGSTLGLVKSIDLSSNMLNGEIPRQITQLLGLVSLNLSRNNLSGEIPAKIGNMKSLDVLDLSSNHLFGQIPQSLAMIDRLGVLDLSKNNLLGKIPTSTQLQSHNESAYMDNPGLCGDPLPKKCPGEKHEFLSKPTQEAGDDQEDKDKFISQGFYVSMGVGCVVGFWGVFGTLLFNRTWRLAYFKMLNDLADWLYVIVAVRKAKLLRTFKKLTD